MCSEVATHGAARRDVQDKAMPGISCMDALEKKKQGERGQAWTAATKGRAMLAMHEVSSLCIVRGAYGRRRVSDMRDSPHC